MRRTALMLAAATLLGALEMPAAAPAAPPGSVTLDLIPTEARHVETFPDPPVPWTAGRTLAYWGKFTSQNVPPGSYRATCMWLANKYWPHSPKHKQDKRLSCTIVIAFKAQAPDSEPSGVILEGFVRRPVGGDEPFAKELFARGYGRQLAITGGSGAYSGAHGYASIRSSWTIDFPNGLSPA
jgi:hypothetical protein